MMSTFTTNPSGGAAAHRVYEPGRAWLLLGIIVVAGLVLRVWLLPFTGFADDMHQIIGWGMLAMQYGVAGVYTHVYPGTGRHLDYPPLYALILLVTVHLYQMLGLADPQHRFLAIALKVPATLADLGLCVATFLLVRRWFSQRSAVVAASIAAVTPSTWLVSSYWGQVDSLAAMFVAFALYAAVSRRYLVAWVCLALGLLVKPLPIVIAPLLLVWQLRNEGFSPRLALGPAASLATAYLISLPFAPSPQPLAVLAWLARFVQMGISRYPMTSVSSFNLYTITGWFRQSDEVPLLGVSLHVWGQVIFGLLLAGVTLALAVGLAPERDSGARERALVTGCVLVLAGMFILLTRMHERYLFFAAALAPALWYAGTWQRVAGATMMVTFALNCAVILWSYAGGASSPSHLAAVHAASSSSSSPHYGLIIGHVVSVINVIVLAALAYYVGRDALRARDDGGSGVRNAA
jgi:Gpi18-like mannosyltransferase